MRKDQKYDYNGKGVMQGLLGSDTSRLDTALVKREFVAFLLY